MKQSLLLILSFVCILSASQSAEEIFKKCGVCHGNKGQKHSQNITKSIAGLDEDNIKEILNKYRAQSSNK